MNTLKFEQVHQKNKVNSRGTVKTTEQVLYFLLRFIYKFLFREYFIYLPLLLGGRTIYKFELFDVGGIKILCIICI